LTGESSRSTVELKCGIVTIPPYADTGESGLMGPVVLYRKVELYCKGKGGFPLFFTFPRI